MERNSFFALVKWLQAEYRRLQTERSQQTKQELDLDFVAELPWDICGTKFQELQADRTTLTSLEHQRAVTIRKDIGVSIRGEINCIPIENLRDNKQSTIEAIEELNRERKEQLKRNRWRGDVVEMASCAEIWEFCRKDEPLANLVKATMKASNQLVQNGQSAILQSIRSKLGERIAEDTTETDALVDATSIVDLLLSSHDAEQFFRTHKFEVWHMPPRKAISTVADWLFRYPGEPPRLSEYPQHPFIDVAPENSASSEREAPDASGTPPNDLKAVDSKPIGSYEWPDEYERDKWIYENIECHLFLSLALKFESLSASKHWTGVTARNAFKKIADRFARFHRFPQKRFSKSAQNKRRSCH